MDLHKYGSCSSVGDKTASFRPDESCWYVSIRIGNGDYALLITVDVDSARTVLYTSSVSICHRHKDPGLSVRAGYKEAFLAVLMSIWGQLTSSLASSPTCGLPLLDEIL